MLKKRGPLLALIAVGVALMLVGDQPFWQVVVALLIGFTIIKFGTATLRALATPVPDPPPPGELRKVKLNYRCSICGTEVRMTTSVSELPDPPRHCMGEMDLVAPVDEL